MEASRAYRVPAPSPICTHPERSAIEQQLIAGTPLRDVACQFGVGRMAVQRHAGVHLPEHLMKAADATHVADVGNAGRLLERLGMLHKKNPGAAGEGRAGHRAAHGTGQGQGSRECLQLEAKIRGEISD